MSFIELKQSDLKGMREKLWLKNNKKCPLINVEIPLDKGVVDHIHKLKSEPYSEQKGTVRDCLDFRSNALEGKISNAWKRYFGSDESKHPISLSEFLRNLADYLEKGAFEENGIYYVHPNEVPKEPKIKKSLYNKLKKAYESSDKKKKFPDFPKTGKITKDLKALSEEFHITLY